MRKQTLALYEVSIRKYLYISTSFTTIQKFCIISLFDHITLSQCTYIKCIIKWLNVIKVIIWYVCLLEFEKENSLAPYTYNRKMKIEAKFKYMTEMRLRQGARCSRYTQQYTKLNTAKDMVLLFSLEPLQSRFGCKCTQCLYLDT